jgi:hypothetical protein
MHARHLFDEDDDSVAHFRNRRQLFFHRFRIFWRDLSDADLARRPVAAQCGAPLSDAAAHPARARGFGGRPIDGLAQAIHEQAPMEQGRHSFSQGRRSRQAVLHSQRSFRLFSDVGRLEQALEQQTAARSSEFKPAT